jgi:hypothetical protein
MIHTSDNLLNSRRQLRNFRSTPKLILRSKMKFIFLKKTLIRLSKFRL